jgi:MFS family permease
VLVLGFPQQELALGGACRMPETSTSKQGLEPVQAIESLWRHGDFLKLWSAQTVSALGDQFTALAIPLIAALNLKATAGQMGILTAAERIPFLIFSLFAGVWVDRLPRRPILIIGDFGRALVLLSIPLAAVVRSVSMLQLYLVALLVGILSVFFDISWQAILPVLVSRKQIVEGNSKLEATRALASLAGPSLAGIAIQYISAPAVIIVDALSFFTSGGFISRIERREPPRDSLGDAPILAEIREGLSLVFTNPMLRSIALCAATGNLFGTAQLTLYILFATRVLALGPAKIGLILSLGNVAGLLGALGAGLAGRAAGNRPGHRWRGFRWRICNDSDRAGHAAHGRAVAGAGGRGGEFRGAGLQHQSSQPAANNHRASSARPNERHDEIPDHGHHAVRRIDRRGAGRRLGPAACDCHHRGWLTATVSVGILLACAAPSSHTRSRGLKAPRQLASGA